MVLNSLKGKCFDLKGVDANGAANAYSFCPYNKVEQYILNPLLTFNLGKFEGWLPSDDVAEGEEDKYSAHLYGGGDSCSDTITRTTTVIFLCNSTIDVPTVISSAEVEMCNYELVMELREWCEVEKEGQAVPFKRK